MVTNRVWCRHRSAQYYVAVAGMWQRFLPHPQRTIKTTPKVLLLPLKTPPIRVCPHSKCFLAYGDDRALRLRKDAREEWRLRGTGRRWADGRPHKVHDALRVCVFVWNGPAGSPVFCGHRNVYISKISATQRRHPRPSRNSSWKPLGKLCDPHSSCGRHDERSLLSQILQPQ